LAADTISPRLAHGQYGLVFDVPRYGEDRTGNNRKVSNDGRETAFPETDAHGSGNESHFPESFAHNPGRMARFKREAEVDDRYKARLWEDVRGPSGKRILSLLH
jgi:hypothetical protein